MEQGIDPVVNRHSRERLVMKLGAKISVSMILLALLATLLAAWLAGFTIRRSFDEYVDRNLYYRLEGVRTVLTDYYLDKGLSLIHISEPTRRTPISYAVFC